MDKVRTITLKKDYATKNAPSIIGRLLPFMIILAFCWAELYDTRFLLNDEFFGGDYFLVLLISAGLSYLFLRLLLWVYASVLKARPYFYLINEQTFNEAFLFWQFVAILVGGIFANLQFFAPYYAGLIIVIKLIINYFAILLMYLYLQKYIDVMFKQMYFKTIFWPWFVYQAICICIDLVLGGV